MIRDEKILDAQTTPTVPKLFNFASVWSILVSKQSKEFNFAAGIVFTLIIAFGAFLAKLPGFSTIGPMLSALIIAVAYRTYFGYPVALKDGIQFSSRTILRLAIILYGFKLNIDIVLRSGTTLLLEGAVTIIIAIFTTLFLAKFLKADRQLSLLLGIGTGICGAAAIAAVAPILKSNDEDTATAVGIIALIGTIFAISYTLINSYFSIPAVIYGSWSGLTLHEIAHVAAAAAPAGQDALSIGLLSKLSRVFLLIPVSFILSAWMNRKSSGTGGSVAFPWFLLGFIVTSLMGSYLSIPSSVITQVSSIASFLLAAAMVGLGLNVDIKNLKNRALRPLLSMLGASVVISIIAYVSVVFIA